MWLKATYAGGVAAMGLVIWATFTGRMPVFFIDGQGGTLLRSLVVSTAVALFVLTAGLLWQTNRRTASPFLYWYALGLVLLAAGLTGSMVIAVKDSPLQWVTRFTQVVGTVYMCVAVLAAARRKQCQGNSAGGGGGSLAREHVSGEPLQEELDCPCDCLYGCVRVSL